MPDFAAPVERLIDELKHLPGIGQKTAQRLAFHLLRAAPEDALALADAIRDAKEKIRSEEHTSELQSHSDLVCRLLLEKKKDIKHGGKRAQRSEYYSETTQPWA